MLFRKRSGDRSHRIGLDIGSHTIKGVEVMDRGIERVIRSAGCAIIPNASAGSESSDDSAVVHAIRQLWNSARFETNQVVMSLTSDAVHMKWLNLESSNADELDTIARTTAARGAAFPVSDAVLDYRVLSTRAVGSRSVHHTMLVAASSSAINRLLDMAQGAGLEPVAVDLGVSAAVRSFEARDEHNDLLWGDQPRAHCIIGAGSTVIAVVRQGKLEFARTVPVGGNDFTQCIVESLGVNWETAERVKLGPSVHLTDEGVMIALHKDLEVRIRCGNLVNRLARETIRSLRFFSSQFAEGSYLGMIGTVTLSGGGALIKGLDLCLRQHGIEVSGIVNPFSGFAVDSGGSGISEVGDSATAFTTAVGLATTDHAWRATDSTANAA